MKYDITPIVQALILLFGAIITVYVVPVVKQHKLEKWVHIGVLAAEQLYDTAHGKDKKNDVLAFLNSKGVDIDDKAVDKMIEAEVLKLHTELYGTTDKKVET